MCSSAFQLGQIPAFESHRCSRRRPPSVGSAVAVFFRGLNVLPLLPLSSSYFLYGRLDFSKRLESPKDFRSRSSLSSGRPPLFRSPLSYFLQERSPSRFSFFSNFLKGRSLLSNLLYGRSVLFLSFFSN